MDDKGTSRDNLFIERFWRTLNWEEVYLRACDMLSEARGLIARYIIFCNVRLLLDALEMSVAGRKRAFARCWA